MHLAIAISRVSLLLSPFLVVVIIAVAVPVAIVFAVTLYIRSLPLGFGARLNF